MLYRRRGSIRERERERGGEGKFSVAHVIAFFGSTSAYNIVEEDIDRYKSSHCHVIDSGGWRGHQVKWLGGQPHRSALHNA